MSMEHLKSLPLAGMRAAAAGLVLAACTQAAPQSAPETSPPVATTAEPFDHCDELGGHNGREALLPFDGREFANNEPLPWATRVLDFIEMQQAGLQPEQLANAYLDSQADRLGAGIEVIFDQSIGLESWTPGDSAEAEDQRYVEKVELINFLTNIVNVIDDYPDGMLPALNVDTIRLANGYASELVAGHFNAHEGEIQVEYDPENPTTRRQIFRTIAHEIGHAVHAVWCGAANTSRDLQLQGNINFIGGVPLDATADEFNAHYGQIPASQLNYGPDRVFPREYGATSVEEYFASIIEHLIEERGLILPGDEDYGSPLQRNQTLVVDRVETLLPGFKSFIEQHTRMLRLNPNNEIYDNLPIQRLDRATVEFANAHASNQDPLVINGILLSNAFGSTTRDGRGGELSILPGFSNDYTGMKLTIEQYSESFGHGGLSYPLSNPASNPPEVVIYPLAEGDINTLLTLQSQASTEFARFGFTPRSGTWNGDLQAQALIDHLVERGIKPIRVQLPAFTPNN